MSSKPKTTRSTAKTKPAATIPPPAASRTTRTATRSTPTPPLNDTVKKAAPRKPFANANRDNSPEGKGVAASGSQSKGLAKSSSYVTIADEGDREPIRAFLRIRPQIGEEDETVQSKPYLEPISATAVRMSDPSQSSSLPSSRLSTLPPSSIYTFSHIFPPATSQSEFFTKTTLPLVKDVLEGQSGLLFAYGVTNSGKTYTIQGASEEGSAGILPRTLDVIFNSIEGLHGDGRFRPVRLQGIEHAPPDLSSSQGSDSSYRGYTPSSSSPALADVLLDLPPEDPDTDPTTLKLDRNHEYTIWLSYAEVYNEKVYDLFASVDDGSPGSQSQTQSPLPRPTSTFLNLPAGNSNSKPLLLTRKALPVKPCPASDYDAGEGVVPGKYIAGQRQIRVTSAAQAKALLRLGQMHRQVFGTLANSQSSRSHALVTIKVLRVHRGERNDPTSIQTSRLTLVDLAGSERTRNTHTTGERLREAGNINKSLMVLGQCMETMRANQRALARSLGGAAGGRMDTRDVRRGLAVVPFRHSKLTEVLMDYFVGEGRAVMIVNVNPYDTGYDENSHVMKFAALAREVCTTAPTAVSRAVPALPHPLPHAANARGKASAVGGTRASEVAPHRRKVTISVGGRSGRAVSETHLEVLEEDEEHDEDDEDDEPINPLVDALFDEIENLRIQLFESEMRCAIIEADTREEVIQEMEERMHRMEEMYTRRLVKQAEQNEMKMDAKIDMLQRSSTLRKAVAAPAEPAQPEEEELSDIDEADEIERSICEPEGSDEDESDLSDVPPSPLAAKGQRAKAAKAQPTAVSSEESDAIETASGTDDYDEDDADEGSDIEEWSPKPKPTQAKKAPASGKGKAPAPSAKAGKNGTMARLVKKTEALTIDEDGESDSSVVVLPSRKTRASNASSVASTTTAGGDAKKKKRQLRKKALVTEEEVERVAEGTSRPLRRSVRGSAR